MPTAWSQGQATWSHRIDRSAELEESNPWAKEILSFYSHILRFQQNVFDTTLIADRKAVAHPEVFRRALDIQEAAEKVPGLVEMVREHAPAKLADEAARLQTVPPDGICQFLQGWINGSDALSSGQTFFARVLFEPQAERLARSIETLHPGVAGNKCPTCLSDPQMAVLRPEGDGGKRLLLCSLCHSEWEYRRVLCPSCGEENHEKLPRYTAEGTAAVRVEACDTCRTYLKSVDLTLEGRAVPEIDEVATAPLDLWAAERDYRKIQPNIMGF